jgi:hypothetical protein
MELLLTLLTHWPLQQSSAAMVRIGWGVREAHADNDHPVLVSWPIVQVYAAT